MLGKPSDYSVEPAAKTQEAYESVLRNMRNLKELEMIEPNLRELMVGKQLLMQPHAKWEVRYELLVKNLPELTILVICNDLSNVGGNNLSDLTVRSVTRLRQLATL
mgnify:CR=1 FL=1